MSQPPHCPKRAMKPFFVWLLENRSSLKQPGMDVADVAKAAGIAWKQLSDKSEWEDKAIQDTKRYEEELVAYNAYLESLAPN